VVCIFIDIHVPLIFFLSKLFPAQFASYMLHFLKIVTTWRSYRRFLLNKTIHLIEETGVKCSLPESTQYSETYLLRSYSSAHFATYSKHTLRKNTSGLTTNLFLLGLRTILSVDKNLLYFIGDGTFLKLKCVF